MIVVVNQKGQEYHEGTEALYEPPPSESDLDPEADRAAEKRRRALALNPVPVASEEAPEEDEQSPTSLAFSPLHTSTPPLTPSFRAPSPPPFFLPSDEEEDELDMATATAEEIRAASYVGFDSITRQIEHKLLKRGFQFNVMVVGMLHLPVHFLHLVQLG